MLNKIVIYMSLCAGALGASGAALAEPQFSPAACYRKCTTLAFEEPDALRGRHAEKMKRIQDLQKQQQAEQDRDKLKTLRAAEEEETDSLKDALDRSCSKMCQMDR